MRAASSCEADLAWKLRSRQKTGAYRLEVRRLSGRAPAAGPGGRVGAGEPGRPVVDRRAAASISSSESTAVTVAPAATRRRVYRPMPQPASSLLAPRWGAAKSSTARDSASSIAAPTGVGEPCVVARRALADRPFAAQNTSVLSAQSVQSVSSSSVERRAPSTSCAGVSPRASIQVPQQATSPWRTSGLSMRSRW
jgi:hypothetical protein